MNLARFLKEESIRLDLGEGIEVPDPAQWTARTLPSIQEEILERLAGLLDSSGKVANRSKLLQDLVHRERKASTALGNGIAVPHVRTMQAREFAMAVGIEPGGLPFGSVAEEEPVKVWIAMIAPPYDDRVYLQIYQRLAQAFLTEGALDQLLEARAPGEVIRILSR